MTRAIFHKIVAAICLTSLLSVCTGSFTKQVLANDSSSESRDGLPGRRVGGGTRGGSVPSTELLQIVPIVPESSDGLTTLENPTLFFSVPKMASPKEAEFLLSDESGNLVTNKKIALNGNEGVVGISILADDKNKSLEIGKKYRWYFAISVDPNSPESDINVTGWIKRVETSAKVASELKDLAPLDRVTVYSRNNLWFDAVATMGELRRSNPNDPAVEARWRELLQSVRLDENISQQPLINYQVSPEQATVVGSELQ